MWFDWCCSLIVRRYCPTSGHWSGRTRRMWSSWRWRWCVRGLPWSSHGGRPDCTIWYVLYIRTHVHTNIMLSIILMYVCTYVCWLVYYFRILHLYIRTYVQMVYMCTIVKFYIYWCGLVRRMKPLLQHIVVVLLKLHAYVCMYVHTYTQKQTCTLTMQPRLNMLLELTLNLSTIYSTTTSFHYTYVCSASLCIITRLYTNIHVRM